MQKLRVYMGITLVNLLTFVQSVTWQIVIERHEEFGRNTCGNMGCGLDQGID